MYKRTGDACHYLPRQGSFSTVPKRNGRVDVLPPGAVDNLYDIAVQVSAGQDRIEHLRAERASKLAEVSRLRDLIRLQKRMNSDGRASGTQLSALEAEFAALDSEIRRLANHVGALRGLLGNAQKLTLPEIFLKVARAELPQSTFDAIFRTTEQIARRGDAK